VTSWTLHFDMRAPEFGAATPDLYRAALELASWADDRGAVAVVASEHHGESDGYLPSPLVMAGALAARTSRVIVSVNALVLTLRDPIAAAEEALVVHQISGGRLMITAVPGYVPSEFAMFGVDYAERVARFERHVASFVAALSGEPFEHEGRTVTVSPGPVGGTRPMVMLGGSTKAAARRAARLADGFSPTNPDPAIRDAYLETCTELGREAGPVFTPPPFMSVFVAEDPDAYWEILGPHALHELQSYGRWAEFDVGSPYGGIDDIAAARATGFYRVLTPDECVELARTLPPEAGLIFKPLIGGLAPEHAWSSLELFASKVLPALSGG
jgi:alkanesulfonate monooxygenase SsuD/methylene tetrahydromethanopterin reductase-like flavin-dependent oxidoreductase (luciferase family)